MYVVFVQHRYPGHGRTFGPFRNEGQADEFRSEVISAGAQRVQVRELDDPDRANCRKCGQYLDVGRAC